MHNAPRVAGVVHDPGDRPGTRRAGVGPDMFVNAQRVHVLQPACVSDPPRGLGPDPDIAKCAWPTAAAPACRNTECRAGAPDGGHGLPQRHRSGIRTRSHPQCQTALTTLICEVPVCSIGGALLLGYGVAQAGKQHPSSNTEKQPDDRSDSPRNSFTAPETLEQCSINY